MVSNDHLRSDHLFCVILLVCNKFCIWWCEPFGCLDMVFLPLAEQNSKKWEKFQLRSDRRRVSKKASYHIYKCHLSEEKEP